MVMWMLSSILILSMTKGLELNRVKLRHLVGTSKQLKVVIHKPSSIWPIRIETAEVLKPIWKGQ